MKTSSRAIPPVTPGLASPRLRARDGVTLIETLISVVLLVVAVGGLLGSSASIGRQMGGGAAQTLAAGIAQARLDSLTSLSCAQLDAGAKTGSKTFRGVKETWQVIDGFNIKTFDVRITVPRRANELRYQMVIPCRN